MKLILTDNDGTLLDSATVTITEWDRALAHPELAQILLNGLESGIDPDKERRS